MGMEAARVPLEQTPLEQLRFGRQIVEAEGRALAQIARRLDGEFPRAVDLIYQCRGNVIVCGMGKAGLVGQKIVATLASTGTPAHCLHPAEAVHGDLGRVTSSDVVLMLSQSGETEEVVRILPSLRELGATIIAITAGAGSTLGRAAAVVIELGTLEEACPLGLAPSTSTTVMLAVGDALALVTSRMRNFAHQDFARFHPAGSLGRKLSKVEEHMRVIEHCRLAQDCNTVREVLVRASISGRRTGAIMLTDGEGRLSGIFTDSDLARMFEHRRDRELDGPVAQVMTADPLTIPFGSLMTDAVTLMAARKISELPVIGAGGKPAGLIDITDVVGLLPKEGLAVEPVQPPPKCRVFPEPQ